jgi:hypothetical protein
MVYGRFLKKHMNSRRHDVRKEMELEKGPSIPTVFKKDIINAYAPINIDEEGGI